MDYEHIIDWNILRRSSRSCMTRIPFKGNQEPEDDTLLSVSGNDLKAPTIDYLTPALLKACM